jgi:ssDNA-binding Zn-finger/Zn-ribbon topoisomerase 1
MLEQNVAVAERTETECPACGNDALYRYGKTKAGNQRFMCLMCGTQFTPGAKKRPVKGKPVCRECGKQMNIYKIEGDVIRFRCSGYPECRTFRKFTMKEEQ